MLNNCWNQIGVWGDRSCPELKPFIHCSNCPVYSAAGQQLLAREAPPGYLNERTNLLNQEKEEQSVGTISLGIFRLGKEWLALPVPLFQEVTEQSIIHTIPHRSNKILLGLVSIRGEIQICISLGELLGLETTNPHHNITSIVYKRMVVVEKEGSRWVFGVDEIYGVYRAPQDSFSNVPTTISKDTGTYTKAIIKWQDKNVICLDDDLVFYTINKRVL